MRVRVLGGGIFGLSAACELAARGHRVRLYEASGLPSEKAASSDISKALRASYGQHTQLYAPLVAESRDRFRALEAQTGCKLFHDVGALHISSHFDSASFERLSFDALLNLGWPVEILSSKEAHRLLPWFRLEQGDEAVWDSSAGWLDPKQIASALQELAAERGVEFHLHTKVSSVGLTPDEDAVVVAVGAWVGQLIPELGAEVSLSRQHEAFLMPTDPDAFRINSAPFWSYDLDTQGWYGFPIQASGILKVACHVPVLGADPDADRGADIEQSTSLRAFIAERIPLAKDAPDHGRTCLYTLSRDHHFVFAELTGRPGVFVAGCGSGHAFKFGLVLGRLLTDALEGRPIPAVFRWPRPKAVPSL